MRNESKYTMVKTKDLANAIRYVSGIPYFTFKDKVHPDRDIYSFPNTEKFRDVFRIINNLMYEYREK